MPWKIPFHYYPYQLAYLSALLKRDVRNIANVKLLDPNAHWYDWEQTVDYACQAMTPDVLITECSALTYPDMTLAMQAIKQTFGWKAVKAWLTGPYGASNLEKCLSDGWDMVFRGEYEEKVLAALNGGSGLLRNGYIDLDWLPFPEDEDISRIQYHECSNPFPGMVQLYPTRGCPLACSFCVVPSYYGGHGHSFSSHRCRNVDLVCDEIEYLARKYEGQFSGCFFNEETHNADIAWFSEFCGRLIDRGLNRYRYDAMCGYWPFTEDSIRLASRAGYCQIRIGIENLSEASGRAIGKRIIPEKLAKVLEWCKAAGIAVYGTTQMGAPGSTFGTDVATLETLIDLKANGFIRTWQNSISTPQPGTPMFEAAKKEGRLLTEDLSYYDGNTVVMQIPGYPKEKIEEVRQMWMRHQGIG
jgi:radical SAM superfamily enzyme YgiQ (UPF0313 family)